MAQQNRLASELNAPVASYQAKVIELLVREHGYTLAEANVFTNMSKSGLQRYEELAVDPSVIARRLAAEIPQPQHQVAQAA